MAAEAADRERIQEAVRNNPGRMTMQLARELGVPEVEVIRSLPAEHAVELDVGRWEELVGSFETLGKVHVIVSNGATTLEVVGSFGNFSTWGDFFNVQTPSLDMHIRGAQLAHVFAVEKPSHMDGAATVSFQFYDRAGHSAFKVFLNFGGPLSPERQARFIELRQRYRK